jgi:hypothetical protein
LDVPGGVRARLADVEMLRIEFVEPAGFELVVLEPASARPQAQLFRDDVPVSRAGVEAAGDAVLELAVAWQSLVPATEAALHFFVELVRGEQPLERIPHEGAIETFVPSPDYELMMWQT